MSQLGGVGANGGGAGKNSGSDEITFGRVGGGNDGLVGQIKTGVKMGNDSLFVLVGLRIFLT